MCAVVKRNSDRDCYRLGRIRCVWRTFGSKAFGDLKTHRHLHTGRVCLPFVMYTWNETIDRWTRFVQTSDDIYRVIRMCGTRFTNLLETKPRCKCTRLSVAFGERLVALNNLVSVMSNKLYDG